MYSDGSYTVPGRKAGLKNGWQTCKRLTRAKLGCKSSAIKALSRRDVRILDVICTETAYQLQYAAVNMKHMKRLLTSGCVRPHVSKGQFRVVGLARHPRVRQLPACFPGQGSSTM